MVLLASAAFFGGAVVSLGASWLLVTRLERIGERIGMSEALLGMLAALAADAPEITAAVTALGRHQQQVGAGVVLGSNVFNLAALLGLGAVAAGGIALHRKVVALGGAVALWVALACAVVITGVLPAAAGLALAVIALAGYLVLLGTEGRVLAWLGVPQRWQAWLRQAVTEEELELEEAIRPGRGRWPDVVFAAAALIVVVAASVTMERAGSGLGQRLGVPQIVTGGLVLAAVTSLPNAVAAIYLARRGRGAATLSTALNSNTLNVVAGLLLPGALIGLGPPSGQAGLVTAYYAGLTLAVLALAYRHRGLGSRPGAAIIAAYAAFTASVLISGYQAASGTALIAGLAALSAAVLGLALPRRHRAGPAGERQPVPAQGAGPRPPRDSLVPGWPASRIWVLSMVLAAVISAADAATGHHLILIGLLITGPCTALLTGRWQLTALTGAWSCCLAILLGIPDGIWATAIHLTFLAAVAVVTIVATAAAALISTARA